MSKQVIVEQCSEASPEYRRGTDLVGQYRVVSLRNLFEPRIGDCVTQDQLQVLSNAGIEVVVEPKGS